MAASLGSEACLAGASGHFLTGARTFCLTSPSPASEAWPELVSMDSRVVVRNTGLFRALFSSGVTSMPFAYYPDLVAALATCAKTHAICFKTFFIACNHLPTVIVGFVLVDEGSFADDCLRSFLPPLAQLSAARFKSGCRCCFRCMRVAG